MNRFSAILSIVLIAVILQCAPPSNPTDDPTNASLSLFFPDSDNTVTDGTLKEIGLIIEYPEHIKSVTFNSSCHDSTLMLVYNQDKHVDTILFSRLFQGEGTCELVVSGEMNNNQVNERTDTIDIHVLAGGPSLSLSAVSEIFTTHTGRSDTLGFTVYAKNVDDIIYAVTCDSMLDSNEIHLTEAVDDESAGVFFNPQQPGIYTVSLTATSDTLHADAFVMVTVLPSILPIGTDNPESIETGMTDTLVFTLTPEQVTEGVTLELLNVGNLPADIATVLLNRADSLLIEVTPEEEGALSFSIVSNGSVLSDTTRYTFTFADNDNVIWNATAENVDAVEGVLCTLSLIPYLHNNSAIDEISLTATIGSVSNDGKWSYTPPWGNEATVDVTITGKHGEVSQDLSLLLNLASGDENDPEIILLSPATESKTVSSSQVTVSVVVKDDAAGVDEVSFATAADTVDGTAENDSIWTAVISELSANETVEVTITAIDKSMMKNRSAKTISLTYDPTMEDEDPPVFTRVDSPQGGDRVTNAVGTFTYTVTDDSGIDSVWWTLNESFIAAVPVSNDNKYAIEYELTDFGENTIKLFAKDGSSGKNEGSRTITLNYNTVPSAIIQTLTETDATDVSTSPTFQWSGGDDADGENVTFAVRYGTSQADLNGTALVDGKTATIGGALDYNETYYWQVTGTSNSTDFPDEVQSEIESFTTEPIFTVSFEMHGGEAIESQYVERNGFAQEPAIPQRNGYAFKGWYTSGTFSTEFSFVTPVTGNRTIHALWVEVYTVTYHDNGADGGEVPTDVKKYESADMVTIAGNTGGLYKDDHDFAGWTAQEDGSGTVYNNPDAIQVGSAGIHLYAKWDPSEYAVTYHLNGGTNGDNPEAYTAGSVAVFNDATKTAYVFKGWYSSETGGDQITSTQGASGPLDLYARWAIEDVDGNTYTEVTIGTQVWMVENLKVTRYNDEMIIPNVTDDDEWVTLTSSGYCWYENDVDNKDKYGAMYNWYAVNTGKLAPEGWHVPSDAEWDMLKAYCIVKGYNWDGTTSGNKIAKSLATKTGWNTSPEGVGGLVEGGDVVEGDIGNDISGNNSTGFSAQPSGGRNVYGDFGNIGDICSWWSVTEEDGANVWTYGMTYFFPDLARFSYVKSMGLSVRCIRDY